MKTIYQADAEGVFQHQADIVPDPLDETYCLPFAAIAVAPPAATHGFIQKWRSAVPITDPQYGDPDRGEWLLVEDFRAIPLYYTESGALYVLGQSLGGLIYTGIGPLPVWLTDVQRPTEFHRWTDGGWLPDEAMRDAEHARHERTWRNIEISSTDYLSMPDYPLTEAQRQELAAYRTALRDWPTHAQFPDASARPTRPLWLSGMIA